MGLFQDGTTYVRISQAPEAHKGKEDNTSLSVSFPFLCFCMSVCLFLSPLLSLPLLYLYLCLCLCLSLFSFSPLYWRVTLKPNQLYSPVRALLLVFQLTVCLLQLVSQDLQSCGQFVLSPELFRQQPQISGGIM